jgi:hypothetical protein
MLLGQTGARRPAVGLRTRNGEAGPSDGVQLALGFIVRLIDHSADIQDRDGARALLRAVRQAFPWLGHFFAETGII